MKVNYSLSFILDSSILIVCLFYTATSALDNESEKVVQEALDRVAQGISM
jgi:ABC-type multidrug transport system fused ATPase/permease subunit